MGEVWKVGERGEDEQRVRKSMGEAGKVGARRKAGKWEQGRRH